MPPRASAAEKGKGPAKRGAKRGADDALSLADLLARCTRADLEALLLSHEDDLPDLQKEVEARLQPDQVRVREGPIFHATQRGASALALRGDRLRRAMVTRSAVCGRALALARFQHAAPTRGGLPFKTSDCFWAPCAAR